MATSIVDAHERMKDFDWTPTYSTDTGRRYPTKFKIPGKTKDPFKTLVREYLSMEQEKDDRQYGGFEDVLSRAAGVKDANPGWLEGMKLALPIVVYAEYGAEKCQSMLVSLHQASMALQVNSVPLSETIMPGLPR